MLRRNTLLNTPSLMPIVFAFEGEGEGGEGGAVVTEPVTEPVAEPAPTTEPSLLGGEGDEGGELTDEQKAAKTEEDRRAALSEEDRAAEDAKKEEDRRAALTDEERKAEDDAKLKEAGAPEKYEFKFEGEDAPQLDEAMLGDFETLLREDNLSQPQADRYMGFAQKLQQSWLDQITQAHVDGRAAWREAVKTDPKLGGEKMAENLAIAKEAVDAFGTPALKTLLNETGIGDHPEIVRVFHNIGVVNREHGFVKSGKTTTQQPFYDHPTSQGAKK